MKGLPACVPPETAVAGMGVSAGIAIGEAVVFNRRRQRLPNRKLSGPGAAAAELERLEKAKALVRDRLTSARDNLPSELYGQAGIMDVHIMLLDDPLLMGQARRIINEELRNAEQAVARTVDGVPALMGKVEDEYIRARLSDVEMLGQALISALLGHDDGRLPELSAGSILVVQDISPADLLEIARLKPAGLITERGSHTSHTAIMAQALDLPAVVGTKNLASRLYSGDAVILDGRSGFVIIRPNQETLALYGARREMEWSLKAEVVRSAHLPALTLDDKRIGILGNMELAEELSTILDYGGEGIGLYRTEFMYLNRRTLPDEEELFEVYRRVAETVSPRPLVIRTLDLGDDKAVISGEPARLNQALGLRGIRYCLSNRDLFKTQLRAILRASAFGELKIMLPMISSLDELRLARAVIAEEEETLTAQGRPFRPHLPVGIMIEVPATIFIARELAEEAAFFSVGTNDLIQYSLAVDRANPDVAGMYQPFHPAILRMLQTIIKIGRETGTPVSFCGDMAAGHFTACALLGLGAETLSMPPSAIPQIKRLIRMSCLAEIRAWAEELLTARTAAEAAEKATRHLMEKFPELFI